MKNTIVLKKVSLEVNSKTLLKNITFGVSPQKPLCIVGRGSSGKSTLLKTIVGLIKPTSGSVLINDISINDKKISKVLKSFGVVFQKDALFDSMRVWENIMFKSLDILRKEILLKRTFKILEKVGLQKNDAFLYPAELSGGMRKRVAIARAISHKPKFLILDDSQGLNSDEAKRKAEAFNEDFFTRFGNLFSIKFITTYFCSRLIQSKL